MYTQIEKLASAVHNNVLSGLSGFHNNFSISMELLEEAIVSERLLIIKEYSQKGVLTPDDLYISINCIPIDCTDIERCDCNKDNYLTELPHFEIPLLITDLGDSAISYIGSNDLMNPFIYYTSMTAVSYRKYRKRKKDKPYVWIDMTPNKNGMFDCFIYNAPLLKLITVKAAFKDPRLLNNYECCVEDNTKSFLDAEIIDRVSKKFITYYRLLHLPPYPNNQLYTQG